MRSFVMADRQIMAMQVIAMVNEGAGELYATVYGFDRSRIR